MFPALLGAPRYPAWPRGALPAAGGAGRSRRWARGRPPTLPRRHPGRAAGRLSWGWARGANSLPSLLQDKRTGPCRAACKVGAGRTRRHGGSGGPCREDRGTGRREGTGPWRPGDSHRTFHQTPASHRSASRGHGVASRPAAASRADAAVLTPAAWRHRLATTPASQRARVPKLLPPALPNRCPRNPAGSDRLGPGPGPGMHTDGRSSRSRARQANV